MSGDALWISEEEVVELMDLPGAIAALRAGFSDEARGVAVAMDKTMLGFDHSTLHALGAVMSAGGLAGTKCWAHTPGGADPQVLLFDTATGALVAVIEAFALGQMRTAGTAALAAEHLARPDARRLGIVGTGKQALAQVAAVAAVRDLLEVRCYSRDPVGRSAFAQRVGDELGLDCVPSASVEEAVGAVDVVTLVTRATEAFLGREALAAGSHVNAVGAIALDRREFEPSLLERCACVVTDSRGQSERLSSELRAFYGNGTHAWSEVSSLAEVVGAGLRRPDGADLTLFKGMGSGVEDLALAVAILARAREGGQGRSIRRGGRAKPRLAAPHQSSRGGTRP